MYLNYALHSQTYTNENITYTPQKQTLWLTYKLDKCLRYSICKRQRWKNNNKKIQLIDDFDEQTVKNCWKWHRTHTFTQNHSQQLWKPWKSINWMPFVFPFNSRFYRFLLFLFFKHQVRLTNEILAHLLIYIEFIHWFRL